MNCDDMINLLNWYRALELRLGEGGAREMLASMTKTQLEARGTQEPTPGLPEPTPLEPASAGPSERPGACERGAHTEQATKVITTILPVFDRTTLSEREEQVLRHLKAGWSNKQIAREVDLTEATIKVHMKSILRKIRVQNRTQAALWAHHNL